MATSVPRAAYALPRPPRARRPVWSNAPAGTSRSSLQSILARLRRAARVRRRPPNIAAPILLFPVTGGAGEGRRCLRRRSPGHDLEASSWTGVTVRRPTARPPAAHDRSHHMVRAPRTGMPARCVAIVPRPKSAAAAFGRVHKGRSKRPHSYPISAGCKTATQAFLCVQKGFPLCYTSPWSYPSKRFVGWPRIPAQKEAAIRRDLLAGRSLHSTIRAHGGGSKTAQRIKAELASEGIMQTSALLRPAFAASKR
jgi:hypothetical protein